MTSQIQHLFKQNKDGNLVYQETFVIEIEGDDKTEIVKLEILPDPLPTRGVIIGALFEATKVPSEAETKIGILPEWYAALQ